MSLSIQPIKYSVMQDSNMGKPTTTSYKLHFLHNFVALVGQRKCGFCFNFGKNSMILLCLINQSPFQSALLKSSITVVNICEESFNHFDIRPSKKSGPRLAQH